MTTHTSPSFPPPLCVNVCGNFPCENQCFSPLPLFMLPTFLRATLLDNESVHCLQLKSFYCLFFWPSKTLVCLLSPDFLDFFLRLFLLFAFRCAVWQLTGVCECAYVMVYFFRVQHLCACVCCCGRCLLLMLLLLRMLLLLLLLLYTRAVQARARVKLAQNQSARCTIID